MKNIIRLIFLSITVLMAGCSHYIVNDRQLVFDPAIGYRYPEPETTKLQDKIYVALAFSGGGTRAAALSYGVLDKLRRQAIGDGAVRLLDEVDVISSISGGSFTSAYFGLNGDRLFADFKEKFLYRDIQGELFNKLFNPVNLFRLISPDFNRIDLATELYDQTVFDGAKYSDLISRGKQPFVALNATNLTTGSRFTFVQPEFDILGSDLSTLPVAKAVAASSAFPFLLSPVSLINYQASQGFELTKDMRLALKDGYDIGNSRRYLWAYNRAIYHQDKLQHPYLHLMDGGLSDNVGVRYLSDNYRRSSGFLSRRKASIAELLLIIVNAKTVPPEYLDKSESPPNLSDVAYKTTTISMDNYSFESVQLVRELLGASEESAEIILACQAVIDQQCSSGFQLPKSRQDFNLTVVEINFLNVTDPQRRKKLLSLPTSFSLEKSEVDDLISIGGELLEQSVAFQKFIQRVQ